MTSSYARRGVTRGTAVVIGCGRVGSSITKSLSDGGYHVRVIDLEASSFDRLPPGAIDDGVVEPIVGDGTREADLRRASAQDADIFVAVTGSDSRNGMAAQIAQHILGTPKVICRVDDPALEEMYRSLGIVTVNVTEGIVEEALAESGVA